MMNNMGGEDDLPDLDGADDVSISLLTLDFLPLERVLSNITDLKTDEGLSIWVQL